MTKIVRVEGTDDNNNVGRIFRKGFTLANHDPETISEGHMDLLVARDHMIAKRDIVRRKHGVGSVKAEKFNNSVEVLTDAIHALNTSSDPVAEMGAIEEDILSGVYADHDAMAGIGDVDEIGKARAKKSGARRANRKAKTKKAFSKAKTKTGKFLKKAAEKAKKGLKAFAKVATAPQRLAVKAVLEILLPKASVFFIYLFINDPAIIAKLPNAVKQKRRKAEQIKNFIVNVIGMKESHFMGILRNGIMKKLHASPETILSAAMRSVSGVGAASGGSGGGSGSGGGASAATAVLSAASPAIPIVIEIIKKLVAAFKKKKEGDLDAGKGDAPDPAKDFEEMEPKEIMKLSSEIKQQNDLPEPTEERTEKPSKKSTSSNSDDTASESSSGGGSSSNGGGSGKNTSTSSSSSGGSSESSDDGGSSSSGGGSTKSTNAKDDNSDTDANGEIKKPEDFATGGRKEWNSLGK